MIKRGLYSEYNRSKFSSVICLSSSDMHVDWFKGKLFYQNSKIYRMSVDIGRCEIPGLFFHAERTGEKEEVKSYRYGHFRSDASSPKVKHKKSTWMSKASREIKKHYKKKCARKKSIKFRQVRVNEIEMISLAFYYSRARQQTKKRQLIDHQLSFSFSCAQDKTRTCTNVIVHYPLKVACLPISPPGHCTYPFGFRVCKYRA